jgi:mRNA-degrading endonuclease toxin of MazEF toxin-antitoxin module
VVISEPMGEYDIIAVIPISSTTAFTSVDIPVTKWRESGLAVKSVLRVHRLTTMLATDLVSELGSLSELDINLAKKSLTTYLNIK